MTGDSRDRGDAAVLAGSKTGGRPDRAIGCSLALQELLLLWSDWSCRLWQRLLLLLLLLKGRWLVSGLLR